MRRKNKDIYYQFALSEWIKQTCSFVSAIASWILVDFQTLGFAKLFK